MGEGAQKSVKNLLSFGMFKKHFAFTLRPRSRFFAAFLRHRGQKMGKPLVCNFPIYLKIVLELSHKSMWEWRNTGLELMVARSLELHGNKHFK